MSDCPACEKVVEEKSLSNPAAQCTRCQRWYHLACVSQDRQLRADVVCKDCRDESLSEEEDDTTVMEGGIASSTKRVLEPPTTSIEERIAELESLMAEAMRERDDALRRNSILVKQLEMSSSPADGSVCESGNSGVPIVLNPGGAPVEPPGTRIISVPSSSAAGPPGTDVDPEPGASAAGAPRLNVAGGCKEIDDGNGANRSSTNSSLFASTVERSAWRLRLPDRLIHRSAPVPLTKDQLYRRKSLTTELPRFNGDPLQWTKFIESFMDTTGDVCGFTPNEEMERIKKALYGPARTLVAAQLEHSTDVDAVIGTLQLTYGGSSLIMCTLMKRATDLSPLKEDLSNIGWFAGQVDHYRGLLTDLKAELASSLEVMRMMERKLPLRHGEEWINFRASHYGGKSCDSFVAREATDVLDVFSSFTQMLHERAISLGRFLPPQSSATS